MTSSAPLWLWLVSAAILAALAALDLYLMSRRNTRTTIRAATGWVTLYVGIALAFGLFLAIIGRGESATEFFAGYVTEYSLSVDNLFVFVLIMTRFEVPAEAEEKVLLIGIVLSLVLRAAFIVAGTTLVASASWAFYVFGALLVFTAWRLIAEKDEPDEAFEEARVVKALRKVLPLSPHYEGQKLRVRIDGTWLWTPLILSIAAITIANFVFALDSMPAILGLTQDSFVILAANAFALLGLRQLYFLIEGLLAKLVYLNYGLALILAFIGFKLVDEGLLESGIDHLGSLTVPEIGIGPSMAFIATVLGCAAVASILKSRQLEAVPVRYDDEE